MELVTGAMASLLPKLAELIQKEYNLQTGVKKDIEALSRELESIEAALRKVGKVPRDQLHEQVRLWANNVRDLSYEMEDVVDGFMVRIQGSDPSTDMKSSKRLRKKIANFFKKAKTRHQIGDKIREIKVRVKEVSDLRDRYKVDDVRANSAASTAVDPRILALFKDQRELVGIEGPRDKLIKRLTDGDDGVANSTQQLKMLSIFGFGGLGKTTLARAVYDKLQGEFVRKAFVSVGQNPTVKKVLVDILLQLDEASCSNATILDVVQLIRKLQGLLQNKRYLIVIDDIWDIESWGIIRCALVESNCGSIVITTTRIQKVAEENDNVYKHEPLSHDNSRDLFYKRLSIGKGKHLYDQSVEISEKILQKCGGVPLAIITVASMLASKPREDWSEVYESIGFGHGDSIHVDNTRKILLYSYYDLPCHLKPCLLHLCIYPEDHEIDITTLIWKWIAEGFVREEPNTGLFEVGERYFNELINRSMIQPIEDLTDGNIFSCRVHDLVLDMIYFLSKEENFIAVLGNNEQSTCLKNNARRLAIQKSDIDQGVPIASTSMPQVRSFNATMCLLSIMPSLSCFQALRVLSLEDCIFKEDRPLHLEHLGKLLQLRYLGMSGKFITELPPEIGNLLFLQTLHLSYTNIKELPQSVGQLRQLKCLHLVDFYPIRVSDWIGKLTSLEELRLPYVSADFVKELGELTELRELQTYLSVEEAYTELLNELMESLANMHKLQVIRIVPISWTRPCRFEWPNCEGLVAHPHLRHLRMDVAAFPRLPAWIHSSRLPLLSCLSLKLKNMETKDMEILGRFSVLVTLRLYTADNVIFLDVMGDGAFPMLRYFWTSAVIRFLPGAMPSLQSFCFAVREICLPPSLDFHFRTIENLPCLQRVYFFSNGNRESNTKKAEAALKQAVEMHSNTPTFEM